MFFISQAFRAGNRLADGGCLAASLVSCDQEAHLLLTERHNEEHLDPDDSGCVAFRDGSESTVLEIHSLSSTCKINSHSAPVPSLA